MGHVTDQLAVSPTTRPVGKSADAQTRRQPPAFDANFDGQKLMYHPREVARWLEQGVASGPIYTEMELCNRCQCRCTFCGVDHLVRRDGQVIDADSAMRIVTALADLGNKSIMFCGNGEPLLNPDVRQIVRFAAQRMSVSVTTNGLALTRNNIALLDDLEWIRFSINGHNQDSYSRIHRTAGSRFHCALRNLAAAVNRRDRLSLPVTVGVQIVLLPQNADGVVELARQVRDIGVDYFCVKPYSQHPLSRNRTHVDYSGLDDLSEALAALASEQFRVIFRADAASVERLNRPKAYRTCYGTDFICFVSANGDIWECNVFVGDPRFLIGNALRDDLRQLWVGDRRREVCAFLRDRWDVGQCRDVCRMDACNRYLWRLKHPLEHDNFI